jgi:pyocin large subunit-like protein
MFPKKGKTFPGGDGSGRRELHYAAAIAAALRAELGDTHRAIKTVMQWSGANEKTVKNWFAGASGPSGEHLVALVRHSDSVLEIFLRLAGRKRTIAENKLTNACETLKQTLALIDTLKTNSD